MSNLEKSFTRDFIFRTVSFTLALLGLFLLYEVTSKDVNLIIDGEVNRISTHSRTVGDLFSDIELEIAPKDQLNVPESEPITDDLTIDLKRARSIQLFESGDSRIIRSASITPANILADAGIRLFPGDGVWIDGVLPVDPSQKLDARPHSIRLDRGVIIDILADGERLRFRTAAPDVGHALLEAGLIINQADRVQPGLGSALKQGMQVEIERARTLTVHMGSEEIRVESAASNVGEMLIETGLSISGMDYTLPDLGDPLPEDGVVRIVRVEEDVLVELEPLPFETVYQPVDELELDSLQVQNIGKFGVQAERIRIRYEDGQEVNRTIEEAVTAVEPEPRVIGYGTKIVVQSLNTGFGTIEYWRAVPVYATSYSPCNLGVDRCGYVTASGTGVDRGTIGVIRSWYNQMRGWPVFVPGYGTGSIQDIGGGFSDRDWIDLGFTDEEYEAWHDWTTLYFLTPVPPLDQVPWILP